MAPQEQTSKSAEGGSIGISAVGQVLNQGEGAQLNSGNLLGRVMEEEALSKAMDDCHANVLPLDYPSDGQVYCEATWDDWGCWNWTLAGTTAKIPCPSFIEGFDTRLMAHKICNEDGTWWRSPTTNRTWSDYTPCINQVDLESGMRVIYVFIAGYAISTLALLLSLLIFYYFKQLCCDRVTLHINLFCSYIVNGIVWILYYTLAAMNADVLHENPVWCQALHVITQYFVTCNFFWMFCEGLYLHTLIVIAFTTGKKLLICCYFIGWCLPLVTTVIYTTIRAHSKIESQNCWMNISDLQWIIFGPIVITILTNLGFLINILRVLVTKLRAVNSPETNQTRKAARAILILIPLLGLQYILFPIRPKEGTVFAEIYTFTSAIFTSFQGLFVALLFCFFNGEVIAILKRKWGQHRLMTGKTGPRCTMYTQTTMTTADEPTNNVPLSTAPRSPRLYDNRCQAPGGKPHKPIVMSKPLKLKKNGIHSANAEMEYCLAESDDGKEELVENSAV